MDGEDPLDRRRAMLRLALAAPLAGSAMAGGAPASATGPGELLRHAAELGDADAVARLIGIGAPLEARDSQGRTPLMLATRANHVEAARILIQSGADVNAKDAIADSPYLYAAAAGRLEILRLCLHHGADLSSLNRYGGTGLIPAAHHGHVEVVHELLKTRISIDHVNRLGWTALLETVILGDGSEAYIAITQALVEAGADPRLADRDGKTPLDHARMRGYREIEAILARALAR